MLIPGCFGSERAQRRERRVTDEHDPATIARAIIDANLYMVLGTADQAGRPWVSPVYYAPAEYREFFWVSSPGARHSRNLEARGEVSLVIFDSSVPIGKAQAVYLSAAAQAVAGEVLAGGIDIFSRRSLEHGGHEWTLEDVQSPAPLRLYRATAVDHYVLGTGDRRVPVTV
jgi:nitroimidazol reductase NimA-like FMN-containing flavoprotein (pyridoxamine 5'-phosphate oxidase superfamily)